MADRIYLGARYARFDEMNRYAEELRDSGFIVDAKWLTGEFASSEGNWDPNGDEIAGICAAHDLSDILQSDIVIIFNDVDNPRGGCHVEFGVALGVMMYRERLRAHGNLGGRMGRPSHHIRHLYLVGTRRNAFHHHPKVEFYHHWEEVKEALSEIP